MIKNMQMALISDIHGNSTALQAVLAELEKIKPDFIVCLGDAVNPYPGSLQVWQELQARKIPCLLGNHEEYVIGAAARDSRYRDNWRFKPAQQVAASLGEKVILELRKLPTQLRVSPRSTDPFSPQNIPHEHDLLLCHASPGSTVCSFSLDITDSMKKRFNATPCRWIAGGHIHKQWQGNWQTKNLFMVGSVGTAFQKPGLAEYAVMTGNGSRWDWEPGQVTYDHHVLVDRMVSEDFLNKGGPVSWLMLDEILAAQPRMGPFFAQHFPLVSRGDKEVLSKSVKAFLNALGRWPAVRPYLF